MLTVRTRKDRDDTGAIAVIFAILAVTLCMIAGLVVDLGLARDTRRQSQNTADASALAAANVLYPPSDTCTLANPGGGYTAPCFGDAITAAKTYAATNQQVTEADWSACTDPAAYWHPAGFTPCISFTDATLSASQPVQPTEVRVLTPTKAVGTGFGSLAGISQIDVRAVARAGVLSSTNNNCALCFLGDIDAGNADFTVSGAGIQVNGDLEIGASAYWTADSIGASGSVTGSHFSPAVDNTPAFTDPLAGLTLPTLTGTKFPAVAGCNTTINPGVYGSISLGNNHTCTLNPGKYVITGRWLLGNKSLLQGSGVTLYFTCGTVATPKVCAAGDTGGGWLDGKNGTVAITSGAAGFTDYVIIYDRLNPQGAIGLQGNGGTSITGAVYAPKARLDFNGNSCFGFSGGPIVVLGVTKANGTKSCVNVVNGQDLTASTEPGDVALDQ